MERRAARRGLRRGAVGAARRRRRGHARRAAEPGWEPTLGRASPARSAIRSTPNGVSPPTASRWSRWPGPAAWPWSARNDPLRASTRGTGELLAAATRRGARRVVVGVGGSATTDGGLGALDALGWSLGGLDVTVACDVRDRVPRRRDPVRAPEGGQRGAGRAADPAARTARARVPSAAPASTSRPWTGAGAAGGLAGGLAALGAQLEPGFEVVAAEAGLDDAFDGADLVVTGEGRLDASSFAGKVVGGVLEWVAELGVPNRAVIAGQATADAREELTVLGPVAAARAHRPGLAVRGGVRPRRHPRGGSRDRSGTRRARRRPYALSSRPNFAAVGRDRDDRRPFAHRRDRPRPARAPAARASSTRRPGSRPARRSPVSEHRHRLGGELVERPVAVLAHPQVDAGRRRPRPNRSTTSTSRPSSTPQPSTNGSTSSSSRRAAYSPPSGWTIPARFGNSSASSGRASSSVTRPPPSGSPCNGRR